MSAAEILVVLVVVGLGAVSAYPAFIALRSRSRTEAAAHELASTLRGLRFESVTRGRATGVWFRPGPDGWTWVAVMDGNGNGIKAAELVSGEDEVRGPVRAAGPRSGGVHFGFPEGATPPFPSPAGSTLADLEDPVRIGSGDVLAFTPLGTSGTGTVYLTDRVSLSAVVVYGRTARVRVLRYEPEEGAWIR